MKSYILSILTVSIIGGIVSSFLSHKDSGLRKRVNFIVGLICAIILISPIVRIAKNTVVLKDGIDSIFESLDISSTINNSNQIIIDTSVEKIESGLKATIVNKFKFNEDDVKVNLTTDTSDIEAIKIVKITITLANEASWYNEEKIKSFAEDLTECAIEIIKI